MHKKLFLPFSLLFAMLGGTVKAAPAMLRAHGIGVVANDTIINNANAEVPAMYPGGEAALLGFINKNLVYPKSALEKDLQGTVLARFEVLTNGTIGNVVIEKPLSPEFDQAVVDVVRKLKRFIPAKKNGRPIPVWFTLPVRFQISGLDYSAKDFSSYRAKTAAMNNSFEVSLHYELCEDQEISSIASLPVYPDGGLSNLTALLKSELKQPEDVLTGQASIWALISETGRLSEISVAKGISEDFDNALVNLLFKKSKEFKPAKDIHGQAVPVWLKIDLSYVIGEQGVDVPAQYPGGEPALLAFISKNVAFPAKAIEKIEKKYKGKKFHGRVIVRFLCKKDGTIGNIMVLNSPMPELGQAAMDVVRKLRPFIPARLNGEPVPCWITIPIAFHL